MGNQKLFRLSSFSINERGGNPAGVYMADKEMDKDEMIQIAKDVGYSETAFVFESDKADFKVRFFTPAEEVDLCGHATIATFNLLNREGIITEGVFTQETKAGILEVKVEKNGQVLMEQSLPEYSQIIDKEEIAKSLNIPIEYICDDIPVQVVSTGLRDIMIPVRGLKELKDIKGNMKMISEISERYNSTGYHVFTYETVGEGIAHVRNFAPLYDIDEESATGTANGALSSYMEKYSKRVIEEYNKNIGWDNPNEHIFKFEQGYVMDSPSEIHTRITLDNGEITKVQVGGNARVI